IGKTLDGTIISWNAGAHRIYGYTADEVVGQPIAILVPRDRPNELPAILERLRRGERISHYRTERIRKDGKRLTISVTISPVRDTAGTVVGASAIARDITEQEQAIQSALRTRDEFISIATLELAETTGREIAVHGPASSGDPVRVDPVRIEEVLTNIIDNAIKYAPADKPIDLELADEPTRIRVAVSDRGPGIPAEDRDRIF